MNRRNFIRLAGAAAVGGVLAAGCAVLLRRGGSARGGICRKGPCDGCRTVGDCPLQEAADFRLGRRS